MNPDLHQSRDTRIERYRKNLMKNYDFSAKKYFGQISGLIKKEKFDEIIDFTGAYLEKYPLNRRHTLRTYNILQCLFGKEDLGRKLIKRYVEVSNEILQIGIHQLGLPPFFEEDAILTRLGELVEQTAYVHFIKKLQPETIKPVMLLPKYSLPKFANLAFLPYVADEFEIVSDDNEIRYLNPSRSLSPFSTFFYKYSEECFGHNSTFYGNVWSELLQKDINLVPFSLKDETIEKALAFLRSYGIKENDPFVVCHFRENGYITTDTYHNNRNTQPLDYIEAIEWLLSIGLKVIRLGNPKMSKMPKRKGFIDLASVKRPHEVDIFACAKSKFYFGSLSGPYGLAIHFGSNCLISNVNHYSLNFPRTLSQLRPYSDKNGKILSMREIQEMKLSSITAVEPFRNRGITLNRLTSLDHISAVKDMIDYLEGGPIHKANESTKHKAGLSKMLTCYTTRSLKLL